ncbi:N-acetylmuramoyl-L-alanine amidase [bacterium]|nr:N-acetylmuramoyl-L-alanine amidase [bacterium]
MKKLLLLITLFSSFSLMAAESDYLICIDPGHGGSDSGAVGIDGDARPNEADFVLDAGLQLKAQLEGHGFHVIITRSGDTYPSLSDRSTQANSNGADRFMSIHLNSYSDSAAHGTETLVYATGGTSGDLGIEVQDAMIATMGFFDRGVKVRTNLSVLKNTTMPAELSEGLFLSNQIEFDYMNTSAGVTAYATSLKDGLCAHLDESCSSGGDTGDSGDTTDTADTGDTTDTGDSAVVARVIGFAYDDAYSATDTDHRIAGAAVTLADSGSYSENMFTDATGLFKFENVPSGDYTLHFTVTGYLSKDRAISIAATDDLWVSTGLTADSGDTADTSDTADTGDTANTGDTADTGDTGDTANTGDTADTADTANTANTADTGDSVSDEDSSEVDIDTSSDDEDSVDSADSGDNDADVADSGDTVPAVSDEGCSVVIL